MKNTTSIYIFKFLNYNSIKRINVGEKMDIIDFKILECLKKNARTTASEISDKVFLSIPAVSERIKKLEKNQIIEQYTIKINRNKIGYKLLAIIFINIDHSKYILDARKNIIEFEEVIECLHMAGGYDYMLKVLVKDTEELENFLSNKLKKIKGIEKSNTMIALSTLKENSNR